DAKGTKPGSRLGSARSLLRRGRSEPGRIWRHLETTSGRSPELPFAGPNGATEPRPLVGRSKATGVPEASARKQNAPTRSRVRCCEGEVRTWESVLRRHFSEHHLRLGEDRGLAAFVGFAAADVLGVFQVDLEFEIAVGVPVERAGAGVGGLRRG